MYVYVCVDMGIALENGEQEAHGAQKPGKTITHNSLPLPSASPSRLPAHRHPPVVAR